MVSCKSLIPQSQTFRCAHNIYSVDTSVAEIGLVMML